MFKRKITTPSRCGNPCIKHKKGSHSRESSAIWRIGDPVFFFFELIFSLVCYYNFNQFWIPAPHFREDKIRGNDISGVGLIILNQ